MLAEASEWALAVFDAEDREVHGYGRTEGKRVDKGLEQTRVGYKKEEAMC